MRESVIYQAIKAEGQDEKAREIALNLLAEGMTVDAIARLTGLSPEAVQQLQQQQTNE
ncbi:helix-turn-helix domain-containing protein [Nostoc sp. FACHB-145]|uniref:helix-turn-helix domain-containing protein n=1 Tax=Nostoc sp. FACHB-145 TaxID=2692836 RepID=UPI001688CC61|nr:helix-turn-helix domain-containing protein [Nostoc sp. FACHB-145]MBD2468830.1 hypothetical protein [Nostoc sp. FACHB-145]